MWRRLAAAARNDADVCGLCGRPIDRSLPRGHPASASADHVVPLAAGGSVHGRMVGVHLVCNQRRQDKDPPEVDFDRPLEWDKPRMGRVKPKQSTDWW